MTDKINPGISDITQTAGTETVPKVEDATVHAPASNAVPVNQDTQKAKKGRPKKKPETEVKETKAKKPKKAELSPPTQAEGVDGEEVKPQSGGLKVFELLDTDTAEVLAKYTNKQPRQAALKAATEGHVDILLREVGSTTKKRAAVLHRFAGERKQVPWSDYGLPYSAYALKRVEELSGKPVPPELNIKGGGQALRDAGFKDFMFWKPNVQKVSRMNVPKVQGKTVIETVREFVKGLGA